MPAIHRPNILFCLFDSLSTLDSRRLSEDEATPTLARLRQDGRLFTSAYAPNPEGSPARTSVLTGLDPCVHGVWTNGVALADHIPTFPGLLSQAGYHNCLVGRWQLAGVSQWTTERIRQSDFSHIEWAHGPLHRSRQNAYLHWLKQRSPTALSDLFTTQADPDNTVASPQQYQTLSALPDELGFNHWIGERVVNWIAAQTQEQPFMAIAGFSVEASMGAEPAHEHDGESMCEVALSQADSAIGSMLSCLDNTGRREDTVVIVAAARGNRTQESDEAATSERSIKTPLLIHRPGGTRAEIDTPISTLDIAPTVLDAAGVTTTHNMQGRSLWTYDTSANPRGWALTRLRNGTATQARDWQTSLRTSNMKLVIEHSENEAVPSQLKLFDLDRDPQELTDLAHDAEHADTLEHMIDQMIDARCALENRTEPRIADF